MEEYGWDYKYLFSNFKIYLNLFNWVEGYAVEFLSQYYDLYNHWLMIYCSLKYNYTDTVYINVNLRPK